MHKRPAKWRAERPHDETPLNYRSLAVRQTARKNAYTALYRLLCEHSLLPLALNLRKSRSLLGAKLLLEMAPILPPL